MQKKEKYFIWGILLLAVVLWGVMTVLGPRSYGCIRIEVDGEEYGTYSLDQDQVIEIGDSNVCEIKNGKVRMTYADCPDQLCIHQGAVGSTGGMIVCLPNKIIIKGEKTDDGGNDTRSIDAVS